MGMESYGGARPGILICAAFLLSDLAMGNAEGYTESTLHTFCSERRCADGAEPGGELVADQSGNLYGTTFAGGANGFGGGGRGDGVVFKFTPASRQYSVIYNFCSRNGCADGKSPYRVKLVIDTAGNLYGTTSFGGSNGRNNGKGGTVFELVRERSGWREKTLYTFCLEHRCVDGYNPHNGLTYAGAAEGARPHRRTGRFCRCVSAARTRRKGQKTRSGLSPGAALSSRCRRAREPSGSYPLA